MDAQVQCYQCGRMVPSDQVQRRDILRGMIVLRENFCPECEPLQGPELSRQIAHPSLRRWDFLFDIHPEPIIKCLVIAAVLGMLGVAVAFAAVLGWIALFSR